MLNKRNENEHGILAEFVLETYSAGIYDTLKYLEWLRCCKTEVFHSYRDSKRYGGAIAVLDIFAAIGAKDYARAKELLQKDRNTWNEPRFMDDFHYLEERIKGGI